ncbi:MAG TPA: helix-turn-helix transcriptional regulator [Actinomycetota bacterium]|nr:helix-turn-helix transcriptional regulator [Actinomycetota bacterium]
MAEHPNIDAATERLVREILRGRDGEVRVRFRVRGEAISMDVLDGDASTSGEHVSFATWMSDLIHSRRMSQEAMARLLGVSLKTVNRWVNGRTEPRMRELRRIQDAFGVAPPL